MGPDHSNMRDIQRRTQLQRYIEAILGSAAEEGVQQIHFIPEDCDIAVYFYENNQRRRVMSIPIASFAELWRLALAPGFETGQHVMTVADNHYLFRIREGRMALGEEVIIEISILKPEKTHPLADNGVESFQEEPWKHVRTILDSIINLGLDRGAERIEMRPGEPDVDIIYYVHGLGTRHLDISRQTYKQIAHYMKAFYFFFGFAEKNLKGRDHIIKPRVIETADDPIFILDIEPLDEDLGDDFFKDGPGQL